MQRFYSKYIIAILVSFCSLNAIAQKFEVGALIGGSYYYGDIVNELEPSTIRGAGGLFLRYHVNERIAIKFFGGYARVTGGDSLSSSSFQKNRNLSFWSDIFEGSAQLEFNLIQDRYRGRRLLNKFIPYAFVGLGGFYFNSKANYPLTNAPIALATLRTEGKAYNQYAVCVPLGLGFRYYVTRKIQLGLELGIRYTSTSYIDDVGGSKALYPNAALLPFKPASAVMSFRNPKYSYLESPASFPTGKQRGKVAVSDIYVIGGLTVSYRFGSGGGGYRGRAVRCPRFY